MNDAHELDVVLDQQDREPLLAPAPSRSVVGQVGGLLAVEARRRLVEQQQPRLGHQRPADLDQPALPEAQVLDRLVGERERGRAGRAPASHALELVGRRPAPPDQVLPEPPVAAPDPLGDEEVLAHRGPAEQLDALERAADAPAGPLVDGQAADVVAVEQHDARESGSSTPSRQLKNVVLPAPFGPIRPDALALADLEAHVGQGDDARRTSWRSSRGLEHRGHATGSSTLGTSVGASALGGAPARGAISRSVRSCGLALARLDHALGVAGELDRAEPEEDEAPLRARSGRSPGSVGARGGSTR